MQITAQTLVIDLLQQAPQTSRVFLIHHTDCVGCCLARFCTLAEVSTQYQLDLPSLIVDLQTCAASAQLICKE